MYFRATVRRLTARALFLAAGCAGFAFCQGNGGGLEEARALLNAGKIEQSEAVLRSYAAAHPASADAHYLLGYVLFREQKPKESLEECNAGAKDRRPHADELRVVASDYVMLGDFADADKWFSQVVAEDPNDAESWYLLGRTKYSENEFAAAISSFEHSLSLHPHYVESENNIGLSWKELNDAEKAKAAFQIAIEWQGDTPVDAQPFLNLGTLLADGEKYADALTYLDRAAALSPRNPAIHEERAKVFLGLGKVKDAQTELEGAVALAPDVSSLHYQLAQVYRKEGLRDRAKQQFDLCQKLSGAHSSSKTPNPLFLNRSDPK